MTFVEWRANFCHRSFPDDEDLRRLFLSRVVDLVCEGGRGIGGGARRLRAEARRVASRWGSAGGMVRIRRRRVVVVPSWTWRLHGRRRLRPSRRITTRGIATTRRMMRRTSTPSRRRWLPRRGASARRPRTAARSGTSSPATATLPTTRRATLPTLPPTRPSRRGPNSATTRAATTTTGTRTRARWCGRSRRRAPTRRPPTRHGKDRSSRRGRRGRPERAR